MPFISPAGLRYLREYKYNYAVLGWIEKVFLTPFWNFAVTLMPMWLAPNLITLFSLLHGVAGCTLLFYHCPTLTEAAPSWVYLVYAWTLFMYQTLDAIDGKQARRTGSSSPLGQLFDHGCDAVSCAFVGVANCALLRLGSTWQSLAFYLLAVIPFFCVNWEEAQTGCMRFGQMSVTEAQLAIIALHIATAVLGSDIWTTVVFRSVTLGQACAAFVACTVVLATVDSVLEVADHFLKMDRAAAKLRKEAAAASTSASASTSSSSVSSPSASASVHAGGGAKHGPAAAALQMAQFIGAMTLGFVWFWNDPEHFFSSQPIACMMVIGVLFAYLTTRLIVAHVTDTPYETCYAALWPMPVLVAQTLLPVWAPASWHAPSAPLLPTSFCVYTYLALLCFVFLHYVVSVVREITAFLDISCFRIKLAPPPQL